MLWVEGGLFSMKAMRNNRMQKELNAQEDQRNGGHSGKRAAARGLGSPMQFHILVGSQRDEF